MIETTPANPTLLYNVQSPDCKKVLSNARNLKGLPKGTYIVNGKVKQQT